MLLVKRIVKFTVEFTGIFTRPARFKSSLAWRSSFTLPCKCRNNLTVLPWREVSGLAELLVLLI